MLSHMLGGWGQVDAPHPPRVTRVVGGSSAELMECRICRMGPSSGLSLQSLCPPGWGRAGPAALQHALMALSLSCLLQRL